MDQSCQSVTARKRAAAGSGVCMISLPQCTMKHAVLGGSQSGGNSRLSTVMSVACITAWRLPSFTQSSSIRRLRTERSVSSCIQNLQSTASPHCTEHIVAKEGDQEIHLEEPCGRLPLVHGRRVCLGIIDSHHWTYSARSWQRCLSQPSVILVSGAPVYLMQIRTTEVLQIVGLGMHGWCFRCCTWPSRGLGALKMFLKTAQHELVEQHVNCRTRTSVCHTSSTRSV